MRTKEQIRGSLNIILETVTEGVADDKIAPGDATITSAIIVVAEVLADIRAILNASSEQPVEKPEWEPRKRLRRYCKKSSWLLLKPKKCQTCR